MRFSRLESGRNLARKPDLRPGSIIAYPGRRFVICKSPPRAWFGAWFSTGLGSSGGRFFNSPGPGRASVPSPFLGSELSRSLKVLDRGRNTQKPARNRSESLCAGLRAPTRAFLAWFRLFRGPIRAPSRRFPAGFSGAFGALLAQPSFLEGLPPPRPPLYSRGAPPPTSRALAHKRSSTVTRLSYRCRTKLCTTFCQFALD